MRSFSLFFLLLHVCMCVCVSFMYTYLCARFVRKFGTDHHHDDVVGGLFLLQETKSSRDDRQRVVQLKRARCFFRFVIS